MNHFCVTAHDVVLKTDAEVLIPLVWSWCTRLLRCTWSCVLQWCTGHVFWFPGTWLRGHWCLTLCIRSWYLWHSLGAVPRVFSHRKKRLANLGHSCHSFVFSLYVYMGTLQVRTSFWMWGCRCWSGPESSHSCHFEKLLLGEPVGYWPPI